jgi:hypothetical protein
MSVYAMALPILPEKSEAWQQYNSQVNGPRRSDFEDMLKRHGFTRWLVWRQKTPQSDLLIVFQEGPMSAGESIGKSDHPFDMWLKDQVKAFTGIDLNQPPPGPAPELVVRFPSSSK